MAKVAFELRSGNEDFSGGSLSVAGGQAFDVAEALKSGGGKIVLDPEPSPSKGGKITGAELERARRDERLVTALDSYPALKRVAAESSSSPSKNEEG